MTIPRPRTPNPPAPSTTATGTTPKAPIAPQTTTTKSPTSPSSSTAISKTSTSSASTTSTAPTKSSTTPHHKPPTQRPFSRVNNFTRAEKAPRPNGNYSHVMRHGDTLHVCGCMGDDPETGDIREGVQAQTNQAIRNIQTCLKAAGSDLDKVISRRIYLVDLKYFNMVDSIWGRWIKDPYPVGTCVGVTGLRKEGALVEVEVVASV